MVPQLGSSSAGAPTRVFEPAYFRRPFLILWAIFVLFYFSELAGFSLSIDEDSALFRADPTVWMEQGRWLAYLIRRFVLPPPVLPFFPLFVFGGLARLGYIAIAKGHGRDLADWRALLLFVLFVAFPTQFFLLDFSFVAPGFGLALLLACVVRGSGWCLSTTGSWRPSSTSASSARFRISTAGGSIRSRSMARTSSPAPIGKSSAPPGRSRSSNGTAAIASSSA